MVEVLCSAAILVLFVSAIFSANQRVLATCKGTKGNDNGDADISGAERATPE